MAQPPIKTTGGDVDCAGEQCGSVERGLHACRCAMSPIHKQCCFFSSEHSQGRSGRR